MDRRLRPAVFLDRDGVIAREIGHITRYEQIELYPLAAEAVAALNNNGWLCVLVTNQSCVARGLLTEEGLAAIHGRLEKLLAKEFARLDAVFYCPHLPPEEGKKEIPPYRVRCACRKPGTGMVEEAFRRFNIDAAQSFIIGDRETDIIMGRKAGLSTVLLRTGYGVRRYRGDSGLEPDYIFDDLAEAARFLLRARVDFKPLVDAICAKYQESTGKRLIVLVGGQSRSGKSTLVRYIDKEIEGRTIPAAVVRLDNWILPLDQRQAAKSVLERYPASTIRRDLSALLAGETVSIEAYDSKTRGLQRKSKALSLPAEGVVIIEGVVALEQEYLRSISDVVVFIDIEKEMHYKRFVTHYRDKDLTDEAIDSLYAERMQDEYPFVEGSKEYADFVI
ncbi:MAG: HAD-IIIA family hydrolase [Bacillota bacterium]